MLYRYVSFECKSGIKTLYFNDLGYEYFKKANFFVRNELIYNDDEFSVVVPSDLNGKIKLGYVVSSKINFENMDRLGLCSAPFAEREFVADKNSKLPVAEQISKALKNMPTVELLEKSKAEMKRFVEFSDATDREFNPSKAENYEIKFHNLLSIDKPIPTWCNRIMFYDRYFKTAKLLVDGKEIDVNLSSKQMNCGYNFIGEVVAILPKESKEADEMIKIETRDGKFAECFRWEILFDHFIKNGEIKKEARPYVL